MKKLLKGIVHFRRYSIKKYQEKFNKLAFRQNPDALLISCCDSRVVPNVFASSDPGDLLVFRNIGNLVPPYKNKQIDLSMSGMLEFAVDNLKVIDIIVCGHSDCGAMKALIEKKGFKNNSSSLAFNSWLKQNAGDSYKIFINSSDSYNKNEEKLSPDNLLSRINVLQQLKHLETYPVVRKKVNNKTLRLHGWWFDLKTADVYYYNDVFGRFIILDKNQVKYYNS